jgi:ABC-2 type transport system permease protein
MTGAAPGSTLWLLRHELRLAWYGATVNKGGRRRPGWATIVAWIAGSVFLHVFAWTALSRLERGEVPLALLAPLVSVVLVVCATFMLSNALKGSVLALFERGDLDLLLSSPLPSRSIFAVRLLGVASGSAALFLYLFAPFANAGLALGRPGWLGLYATVAGMALIVACAAMLLTLALVRLLGARRTRVLAQVLAAVAGAALFLLSQAYNLVGHRGGADAGMGPAVAALVKHPLLGPDSPLWLPGRAALGAPLPLLGLLLLAGGAFVLTVGRTHRFFVHGLQQAAGSARAKTRPTGAAPLRLRFRTNLFDAIVVKEWRLIARDPHLISQVLLQLVYLAPLLLLVFRGGDDTPGRAAVNPAVGAGLTLLCSSLTGGLAWIVISAEEASDLLLSSPAARRTVRLAKLAAAAMPALLVAALPLLWLIVRAPLAGLMVTFTTVAAVLGAALVVLWVGKPASRSDFKARGKENFLCSMLELLNTLSWGGLAWLLVALTASASNLVLAGTATALAAGCLTLLLAWLLRRRAP